MDIQPFTNLLLISYFIILSFRLAGYGQQVAPSPYTSGAGLVMLPSIPGAVATGGGQFPVGSYDPSQMGRSGAYGSRLPLVPSYASGPVMDDIHLGAISSVSGGGGALQSRIAASMGVGIGAGGTQTTFNIVDDFQHGAKNK